MESAKMVGRRPHLLCAFVIFLVLCLRHSQVHTQLTSTEVGQSTSRPTATAGANATMYAWSAWGTWSQCSRTCGGGVSVQERQCLPRDPSRMRRSRKRRKLVRGELVRRARVAPSGEPDCPGLGRRYHECNTAPCPGPHRDPRSEQCAVYDRRPFRGRFYTWVPYVDGNAPCTLNCRPRGQQFYASLALVSDGTPCTKPGFRAICVQGTCMAVGHEGVLASSATRDLHCGRRLVTGLFTRPRLPLGYTYVTTVPRGACRLNVSEIMPSENYIALKVTNGSHIMNGEFAVSPPGTYEAAGARFIYSREASLDSVFAHGPIHQPVDIMVLYTQPNPSIKYEYYTDSEDGTNELSNSIPQHHQEPRHFRHHNAEHTKALNHKKTDSMLPFNNFIETNGTGLPKTDKLPKDLESRSQIESNVIGNRQFIWKILDFTQCSRSCGGGLQVGSFKCVEVSGGMNREVSPAHCDGAAPPSRRRRCGGAPCPARWRAAPWSPCPVCGPAHRTRIVGCVQDHARGITKISDSKCPLPMPPSSEACNIPNCDGSTATTVSPRLDARRQVRPNDRVDNFRDGSVVFMASNATENEFNPTLGPAYSFSGAGGWLYTDWSECVGWCVGGGVQSRGVRCSNPSGCSSLRAPESTRTCSLKKPCLNPQWFTGEWSTCSASCEGKQIRGIVCIGGNGRRLRDNMCQSPKPETERSCGGKCSPSWYLSDWSECQGPCEAGIQTRTVWCARGGVEGASGAARDTECPGLRPAARRACVPPRCSTRTVARPTLIKNPTENQPRITRHQNSHNTQNAREQPVSDGACVDKLSNCVLAVQARLCHYPYYADYCCRSCHGR